MNGSSERPPESTARAGLPALVLAVASTLGLVPAAPASERLERQLQTIDLPGAPAAILPADLDRDGIGDLVIVVAYSEWDQIGTSETVAMDEVEGLVEMMTIVPALFERRELIWLRGRPGGGFESPGPATPLERSVITIESGPPGIPLVALTDAGIALVEPGPSGELELEPLIRGRSVLSGAGALLPTLGLMHDIDGDDERDLVLPAREGMLFYRSVDLRRARSGVVGIVPVGRVEPPLAGARREGQPSWNYALPQVADVDGDGTPDLVLRVPGEPLDELFLHLGLGTGEFVAAGQPLRAHSPQGRKSWTAGVFEAVHFGDLDGDGVAELVVVEDLSDDDAGFRKEMREARRPPTRYRVYRMGRDLSFSAEPVATFDALGYAFADDEGSERFRVPGGFQDLDGDGRRDLIAVTLDFGLLQVLRILATRSIDIGLDFHLYCQNEQGSFEAVEGLDLSGRFRVRLANLRLGQLSQFAGDFDGDGRADFLQMGRGRDVTLHLGQPGCRYAPSPDLTLRLDEPPGDLALLRVGDFDADTLADLAVVQPGRSDEQGETAPVRLQLYLSRGGEE